MPIPADRGGFVGQRISCGVILQGRDLPWVLRRSELLLFDLFS